MHHVVPVCCDCGFSIIKPQVPQHSKDLLNMLPEPQRSWCGTCVQETPFPKKPAALPMMPFPQFVRRRSCCITDHFKILDHNQPNEYCTFWAMRMERKLEGPWKEPSYHHGFSQEKARKASFKVLMQFPL